MKEKFSVLMSVYYKEKPEYLREALDSIFNQSVMPDEVVLVEDGELTKQLDKVIKQFEKQYKNILRVIKFKENRGLGKALHDGLLECSNEIVFRMDSDDISLPTRFEEQLKVFCEKKVDIVGTNILEFNENMNEIINARVVPESDEDIKRWAIKRNPINHMTVAFKKTKVLQSGNYQDMLYFEDYYLWARMIVDGCIFYNIQKVLVNVRGGNDMVKRRGGKKYITPIITFQKSLYDIRMINKSQYLINCFRRIAIALLPNDLRFLIYKIFLRKNI